MNKNRPTKIEDAAAIARKQEMKEACISATKFIVIRLALIIIIILYSVAGAFIFQHLESENEMQGCVQSFSAYKKIENATIEKIFKIAQSFPSPGDAKFALTAYATQLLEFNFNVLTIGSSGGNCSEMGQPDGPNQGWSFYGSLLFSTTIFTTVGYGNIAPKTNWGRLVSIAYAIIGVPLMLLMLSSIGEIMANIFRYTYLKICCCGFLNSEPPPKSISKRQVSGNDFNQRTFNSCNSNTNITDDDEDDDDDEDADLDKISVPVCVALLLIGSVVFIGSLLFSTWEGWSWMDAAYFSFVTIATIGFGDFVPGTNNMNTIGGQLQMIATAVYMTCGMAILSMSFNLMQEEVIDKIDWLTMKCRKKKKVPTANLR